MRVKIVLAIIQVYKITQTNIKTFIDAKQNGT